MEDQYASANTSIDIECANPGWGSTFFSECANPGWGSTFFPECVLNIMEDQCATTQGSTLIEVEDEVEDEDEDEDNLEFLEGRQIYKLNFLHPEELTPRVVSFGPYYHCRADRPELDKAQKLKRKIFEKQISSSGKDEKVFSRQISKVIDKIRNCYHEVSKDECDDRRLTEMMLLDASFAAFIMMSSSKEFRNKKPATSFSIEKRLGYDVIPYVRKDMLLLDNQIPLWVIMRFFKLIYGNEKSGREILHDFVTYMARLHSPIPEIPGEKLPLHLLDAIYRVLVQNIKKCQCFGCESSKKEDQSPYSAENRQFRSVTDLKAKGIKCEPSSQYLNDIDFKSDTCEGQLQLPVLFFHQYSKLLFINLVAYEMHPKRRARPESPSPGAVSAYVNFLKSLVIKPEDVKELRERKILFSSLNGDEKVLQVIKDISIPRGDSELEDVKMRIEDHCSSKAKTWFAELKHTYFRNPWSIFASLTTAALLMLTFLQTCYTMKYHN